MSLAFPCYRYYSIVDGKVQEIFDRSERIGGPKQEEKSGMIQYRKAGLADYEKVYRLICELECKELPAEKFYAIYQEQINDSRYSLLLPYL